MKTILFSLFICLATGLSAQETVNITLEISSIKSAGVGTIQFMLFDSGKGFPKNPEEAKFIGKVDNFQSSARYTFKNIPKGTYAIAAFQDQNKNGKIDSNMIGMPKEPVAASNQTKMAKPTFNRSAIDFQEDQTIQLQFINDK
ncbi:MAG: DUF2141 domain-containing protein [Bacteroidota bacterium]